MRKFTALLLAILMLLLMEMSWAQAAEDEEVQGTEVQEDQVVAIVNGEEILLSTLETIEAQYESLYEDRGYDLEEESVRAHLSDTALSALIEALLIEQDMRAQGFYDFDEEEEAAFEQLGQQAYDACLQELESAYFASMNVEDTQDELTDSDTYQAQTDAEAYAVRMASQAGYSAETLAQNYRDQAALEAYQASLMEGEEITEEDENYQVFYGALLLVCRELSKRLAADGEGATKLLICKVQGAKTVEDAKGIAKSIICSSLVKAAMFGSDANWGRVLCAIGYSGCQVDIDKVQVEFQSQKGSVLVCENGAGVEFSEEKAKEILLEKEITIAVTLGDGEGVAEAYGCDLTYDYVKINGDYRT